MNTIKVLVIGGSGFIGSYLVRYFSATGTSTEGNDRLLKLNITVPGEIDNIVRSVSPDIVINASGITNVDYCEDHREEAMSINGNAVGYIADSAEKYGAFLCHISTDYIFPGTKGASYTEEDLPDPINVYGESKLKGEQVLKDRKSIIVRISTPYGINLSNRKKTFLDFVVNNLRSNKPVRIVNDQYTTPTYINDIPVLIERLFEKNKKGIYHLGSMECINRLDFSLMIAGAFHLNSNLITPCKSVDIDFKAPRPKNTCLSIKKISEFIDIGKIQKNLEEISEDFQKPGANSSL